MSGTTEWPEVRVCIILPCGTVTLPVEDGGTITCRAAVGHLDAPDTGLIEEMRNGREPTPWRSAEIRDAALVEIDRREDLDDETRRRLRAHVRRTPWYE